MTTAIVWFRRDLRLTDHPALDAALAQNDHVVAVYIHAPEEESPWQPGGASRWWLHHSLKTLDENLRARGSSLLVLKGDTLAELRKLLTATGATAVHWNRLYEPAIIARDKLVKEALRSDGIDAQSHNGALLFEPWTLKTGAGDPYRVFTPFWRNASAQMPDVAPLPAPERIPSPPKLVAGVSLDALGLLPRIQWDGGFYDHWRPGEAGALQRLDRFCDGAVADYKAKRDYPAVDATSSLSPYLHFGDISPRQIVTRIRAEMAHDMQAGAMAGAEHFIREVGWREFGHHLLFHYPQTPETPLYVEKYGRFPWRQRADYIGDLEAWQQGRTGIPIVDAGMRQLWHTGWMHNRVRMIVASLLTKNLLIPWQEGARWFWDTLVDASLANNTLGWQWSAGCGADAAPYYRIFNPILQSAKFDEQGSYLRRWIPELKNVPLEHLHAPWEQPSVLIGTGYPKPIVDLAASRQRALNAYEVIKTT
jgi:deoxyribodipyrimidine photo-lyase